MSALAGATQSVEVRLATRFTALPKPRFSSDATRLTHGNRSRTRSAEPSSDALSTTQTSVRPRSCSGSNERRQRSSRSRVFQETTATAIFGPLTRRVYFRG
jgi:hypothetical protein